MKTLLVPVDFSPTAINAARYAQSFAQQVGAKIMLLHAWQPPLVLPMQNGLELTPEGLRSQQLNLLQQLAQDLNQQFPLVKVEYMQLEGTVADAVNEFTASIQTLAVVMGITGGGAISEQLIGSNTLAVAQQVDTPVLIVPPDARFNPVTDIGFATDFRDVANTTPVNKLRDLLLATGARLHVLNVDYQMQYSNEDTPLQSGLLDSLFHQHFPHYHFIENENIAEGLSEYAADHGIELLVVVPRKHNLLDRLFNRSATRQLVFHSHVPVLVIHD